MKRLLLDLNVVLDVVLDRAEAASASALWAALERGKGRGYVPAHGITTIFYLVNRAQGPAFARRATDGILRAFAVAPVDEKVLRRALSLGWADFEDAVCASAAEHCGCDAIVTRDPKGFVESPVRIVDCPTALAWMTGT
ncbi:MAG TPA: PIN domain-containing protein [Polyangia bacterium]